MPPTPLDSSLNAAVFPVSPSQAVTDYGDVRAEFAALISGCGIYDLSGRAKIKLTGSDRVRWLNGMVTNNIRDLAVNHAVYAFLLNPQGRILADLYAYNCGESLLLDTDRSQLEKVLGIFDKYIIMDDVEVANVDDELTAVGIAGPNLLAVMKGAGIEIPDLQALQFAGVTWQNTQLTVVHNDNPGVEAYELWVEPKDVSSLWDMLVKAGAKPAGTAARELLRIASGLPRYGQDMRERDLPQETSQDRALHFSKGCYVGQEIVERIRSRGAVHRQFAGFEIKAADDPFPVLGTKIQADGKDVGEITSVASLPTEDGDRRVALGYIRREAGGIGKQVQAGGTELTIAKLPFIKI